MRYLVGIDLGTTGCKSMVVGEDGTIAGSHYIEYDLIFTEAGVEQDANLWWEHTKTAIKGAIRNAGVYGKDIAALAVSSQGIAFVPVDKGGRPLANAVSWYDTRALAEAREMAADYGADYLFNTTGRPPSSLFFPEVLHLKRHNPMLYEKTFKFLMAQEYLCYRFCGQALTDYTMASGTLCFDTAKREWIDEFFIRYGIDKNKFPDIKRFGEKAGTILPEVADELGISDSVIVAVGMQDQKAAALGAGIMAGENVLTLSLGTSSAICVLSEHICDPTGRVLCHAFDGRRYILENHVGASGAALKWLRNTLFPEKGYAELDKLAAASKPGSGGVVFNPGLDGKKGFFAALSLSTDSGDLVRAVLEGIAYAVKQIVEIQQEVSSAAKLIKELRIFGGGAASPLWPGIIADCTGLPVVLSRTADTANLGAAACAGMALGLFPGREVPARFTGDPGPAYFPNRENTAFYNGEYQKFLALRNSLGN
jgi:xylulokinase